jgi:16S rRNA (guanine527-N7)-methyltransferase
MEVLAPYAPAMDAGGAHEQLVTSLRGLCRGARIEVAPEAAERIVAFLARLLALNEIHNLTAIRDPGAALVLHALDSLHALPVLGGAPAGEFLDLGTGNGFPGVAAAACCTGRTVVFVERRRKKATAVAEALAGAGIRNVEVVTCDAKDLVSVRPASAGAVAAVLARAFGPLAEALGLARPWLVEGGLVVHWKEGQLCAAERADAARRARSLGMSGLPDREYSLPPTGPGDRPRSRRLVLHRLVLHGAASRPGSGPTDGHRLR